MPYKHILVPVDGSETADKAMREAIQLAKLCKAHLHIVYVADEFVGYIDGLSADLDKEIAALREQGQAILKRMATYAHAAGLESTEHLIEIKDLPANVPEKIIEEALKVAADLLVVGTHGRSGFKRMILGSVADALIHLTHLPILLIQLDEKK